MKRFAIALALATGLLAGSANAGYFVASSNLPDKFPEGTELDDNTKVSIPAGGEITAVDTNGDFIVLKGPANGTVKALRGEGSDKVAAQAGIAAALFGGKSDNTIKVGVIRGLTFGKKKAADTKKGEPMTKAPGTAKLPKVSVTFEPGAAYLGPNGRSTLDVVASVLSKKSATSRLMVTGYIDSGEATGAEGQALSEQRAESVRQYLIARHNLPPTQVFAVGQGVGGSNKGSANRKVDIFNIGN